MVEFQAVFVRQKCLQVGGIVGVTLTGGKLHEMRHAVARGKLNQTKSVTKQVEPHGFGVDGNHVAQIKPVGQVVTVEFDIQITHPICCGAECCQVGGC